MKWVKCIDCGWMLRSARGVGGYCDACAPACIDTEPPRMMDAASIIKIRCCDCFEPIKGDASGNQ